MPALDELAYWRKVNATTRRGLESKLDEALIQIGRNLVGGTIRRARESVDMTKNVISNSIVLIHSKMAAGNIALSSTGDFSGPEQLDDLTRSG